MRTEAFFQKWHYRADRAETSLVFPDGCRDIMLIRVDGGPDHVVLTEFDFCPRNVNLPRGTEINGYRLRPGVAVGRGVLDAIAANHGEVENILGNELAVWDEMDDAIRALALSGSTVQSVSKHLGVSVRTLQRRFLQLRLPPPDYWRLLGRARRAVGQLPLSVSLADIAFDCGFSDQAHMTREFMRWFGRTPTVVRQNARLFDLLRQPALGNWTGEQISTR